MRLRLRSLIWLILLQLFAVSAQCQTSAVEPVGPTLKSKARLVVVDVVVTDRNDQPVTGLRKEDFRVSENGKPQVVSVFEEHTGKAPASIKPPALPPNTFSNVPRADAPDTVNVVLLDALNTPIQDQSQVHQQILKYLAGMHPGARLAIFLLSSRLRLVQGFTTDPALLLAALNDKNSRSGPQASPLLRSGTEIRVDEQAIAQMQSIAEHDPNVQAAMDALRQFQAETAASQTDVRIQTTLFEFRQLAGYLSGVPGRKNVIWFSGAFPLNVFQNPDHLDASGATRQYEEDVRNTAGELTRAQVAIYPVEAGGLAVDPTYDASAVPTRVTGARTATESQVRELNAGSNQRNASHATMDELAHDTGGQAFYNTNGLDAALATVIRNGARYYTLDYVPSNKRMDGRYRRIQVRLTHRSYKLAYRRGYSADDARTARAVEGKIAASDPLQPLMAPGLPNFAQIVYLMSVKASTPQPGLTAQRAGDNSKLEGPFTRMDVDLAIREKDLQLEATPEGVHHGVLEVTLITYDRWGNQLNWLVRNLDVSVSPEHYKEFLEIGLQLHFEFDAPRGASYLRSGVCDLASGKAGTIEVLLSAPAAVLQQAKPT